VKGIIDNIQTEVLKTVSTELEIYNGMAGST
jgi:hypothetical protein